MSSHGSMIVGGARTPFGKLLGGLSSLPATDLGAKAIAAALERSGVDPGWVEQVIMGQVLPAGGGQLTARQAAVKAGVSMDVPALTINKVCLSGLTAVAMADQLIRAGEAELVVAGGMESMSNAPHLLLDSRKGHKYGAAALADHMELDALSDVYTEQSMGALTEQHNQTSQTDRVSRAEADAFAARSHRLAAAAADLLAEEIVEVRIPQRKGEDQVIAADEGVRAQTTTETLAKLRPAFSADGTITAGSSSPISDGAAAVVVASAEAVERHGLQPLARIGAYGQVAGPDSSLQLQPANAIVKACAKAGIDPLDLDLIEINEAFATVGLASARALGLAGEQLEARLNVHGGAIALGHPVGASGARLVLTLAGELHRRGTGLGAAALCGGGGQGDALVLHAV